MAREDRGTGVPHRFTNEELAYYQEHFIELRSYASGPHYIYWGLAVAFVVGLAAHIAGYLLRIGSPPTLLGLLADLLYALGASLWSGVVLVLFVQIVPEAKRRQIMEALDAYRAMQSDRNRAQPDPAAREDDAPAGGGPPD